MSFLSEFFAIGYTSFLVYLIEFIRRPESGTLGEGVGLVAIFGALMMISALFKNVYIHSGYLCAMRIRKTLVTAMYLKISKLSMKSLTETNSGKLISIVSGDIQSVERPLAMVSQVIAAPFINLVAYIVLGVTSGWRYSLITFLIWVVILVLQHYSSKQTKTFKGKESVCNDERMKLVNDMVNGARTIKCYGWENFYMTKIKAARATQKKYVFLQGLIGFLGLSFF